MFVISSIWVSVGSVQSFFFFFTLVHTSLVLLHTNISETFSRIIRSEHTQCVAVCSDYGPPDIGLYTKSENRNEGGLNSSEDGKRSTDTAVQNVCEADNKIVYATNRDHKHIVVFYYDFVSEKLLWKITQHKIVQLKTIQKMN